MEGGDAGRDRLSSERDLLWQLLELGLQDDVDEFLGRALGLLIEVVGARRGYIELRDPARDEGPPAYALLHGMDEQALSADDFSRSVIARTFATGETVVTASARTDPRFSESGSVRMHALEAVLCAPMGHTPVVGVIYLQDRREAGPFSEDDRARAELFARHVGRMADRLLLRTRQRDAQDPTLPLRRKLEVQNLIGSSAALAHVLQQVAAVAPLNIGVLLTGDSGTGKTVLARAIHDNSPRASGPFVEVNCATLPAELAENELFGAVAGAHSTARNRAAGKVEAAEGGTLFLDEVGELPVHAQAKLLQVLQSNVYYKLGDTTERYADVRVVAATNADLKAAVRERRFREDLYYRLSVFPIRVPSLEERREDVPALSAYWCKATSESNALPLIPLSPGALLALEHARWPGNVRQLSHVVQRGVVRAVAEGAARVERRHLFPEEAENGGDDERDAEGFSFEVATRAFQKRLLLETLVREGWNVAAAARRLELTRAHVYNLLKTFGITRPESGDEL